MLAKQYVNYICNQVKKTERNHTSYKPRFFIVLSPLLLSIQDFF
jgi:hypothetical protein